MNIVVCVKQVPGTTNVAVDPETGTLVRDGEKLSKSDGNGVYVLSSVQPYDMFPQTKHIETLVCLVKAD